MKKICTYLLVSLFCSGVLMAEERPLDSKLTECLELNKKATDSNNALTEAKATKEDLKRRLNSTKNKDKIAKTEADIATVTENIKKYKVEAKADDKNLVACKEKFDAMVDTYTSKSKDVATITTTITELEKLCAVINGQKSSDFVADVKYEICSSEGTLQDLKYELRIKEREQKNEAQSSKG